MGIFRLNCLPSRLPASLLLALSLTSAGAASAADFRIGAAEALSGPAAQYGQSIRNGLELAAEQINAAGGINSNPVTLVIEDEQGKGSPKSLRMRAALC